MVFKCCVPNCRGNYENAYKVHVFKFPTDEHLKKQWSAAIKRKDFVPTKNSVVCELHFPSHEIRRNTVFQTESGQEISVPMKIPRLASGAIPSLLPNCPAYLSKSTFSRDSPQEKRVRRENRSFERAIEESAAQFHEQTAERAFASFQEFKQKLPLVDFSEFWSMVVKEQFVYFININACPAPKVICSLVIGETLDIEVYFHETRLVNIGSYKFPDKVYGTNVINDVLVKLESFCIEKDKSTPTSNVNDTIALVSQFLLTIDTSDSELENPIKFVLEQLKLMCNKRKTYSTNFLIIACMLYSISPHCYRYIRHLGFMILPHPSTIKRICSSFGLGPHLEQHESNFLMYIKKRFSGNTADKFVVLMLDEIHIKAYMDYKGGNIVGGAFNNERLASSAHCFMISSLLSGFKEVVHIVPVKTICAEKLHEIVKKVVIGLENIGFLVVCVVTDNNSINRKCLQMFSSKNELSCICPHPADESRPLFVLFDSVHILKCIRNNWLNQKNSEVCISFPNFHCQDDHSVHTASFGTVRKLYELEEDKLLKYSYGLSVKALSPSSFERQNVKLVLQVFNENVIQGLKILGEKHNLSHYSETANFIEVILNWWNIVNVKTPGKGRRLNNVLMLPVVSENDESVQFLKRVSNWLNVWKSLHIKNGLTNETMSAMILTTDGLLKLMSYCLNELNFQYFLPEKCQTDALEGRFGQYRQLAGGQYNVSLRQVFEVEQKLRLQSCAPLKIKSVEFGDIEITQFHEINEDPEPLALGTEEFEGIDVCDKDIDQCNENLPILVYLAGYCCYSILKNLKCLYCKDIIVTDELMNVDDAYNLIDRKNRGKLLYPQLPVVNVIVYNYLVISKCCNEKEKEFLQVRNQRELACEITFHAVTSHEILWEPDVCSNGHTAENICKKLIWVSSNIFLNNYCKRKNTQPKSTQSRKRNIFNKNQ